MQPHAKLILRIPARASTLQHTPHTAIETQREPTMHIAAQRIATVCRRNAACGNWPRKTPRLFRLSFVYPKYRHRGKQKIAVAQSPPYVPHCSCHLMQNPASASPLKSTHALATAHTAAETQREPTMHTGTGRESQPRAEETPCVEIACAKQPTHSVRCQCTPLQIRLCIPPQERPRFN